MKSRYNYRIYPTAQQKTSLAQAFGCSRVVWNDLLVFCKTEPKYPGFKAMSKYLTKLKKTPERSWLNDVSCVPLQQTVRTLDKTFQEFFKSCKGERKGTKVGFPKFKKKTNSQSIEFTKSAFKLENSKLYLAKIGMVKTKWSRPLPSQPSSVTILKDCANRYFVSFVVETSPISVEPVREAIGVDLGIKTFAVCSDGSKFYLPDFKKLDRKVRRLQRSFARCVKGSKRRERLRLRIARLKAKIADTLKDFHHKVSTTLARENQTVRLEDLNVKGMLKNRKLARSIATAGWGQFRILTQSKCIKYNRTFELEHRFSPTSQTCSTCGFRWGKIGLGVRTITCLSCGTEHDRDENASINIKVGLRHHHDSKRTVRDNKTTSVANPVDLSNFKARP